MHAVQYIPGMAQDLVTAEELPYVSPPHKRTELVRGVLVVREPPGYQHGYVVTRLALAIGGHVRTHDLGHMVICDTGFKLFSDPDTVRGPDIAFVRKERVPDPLPEGFAPFAPDLAVEVRSPGDRPGEVLAKVADWLEAGTALVWVVDPARREARVYRADGSESVIAGDGALEGEALLPGFECRLAGIF